MIDADRAGEPQLIAEAIAAAMYNKTKPGLVTDK